MRERIGVTSWGSGKITERDLRETAKRIAQGIVKRRETEDVAYVTLYRWSRNREGSVRIPNEVTFVSTARTRILEGRGYAVLGEDKVWALTIAGEMWLAGFVGTSSPATVTMVVKEEKPDENGLAG